jgi:hypothetical protein
MIRRIILTIAATAEFGQKPNRAIEKVNLESGHQEDAHMRLVETGHFQRGLSTGSKTPKAVTRTILDECRRICGCHWKAAVARWS